MNSRYGAGTIYFFVIIATLLMRMAGGLGVYDAVNVDSDVFFTLVVQLLCFGALPLLGYFIVSKQLKTDQIKPLLRDFNFRKCSLRNFGYCLGVTLPILFLTGVISFAWQNVLALIGYTHSAADPVTPTVGHLSRTSFWLPFCPVYSRKSRTADLFLPLTATAVIKWWSCLRCFSRLCTSTFRRRVTLS